MGDKTRRVGCPGEAAQEAVGDEVVAAAAFAEVVQTIMDSYSTASYQEVNPGLFAVITCSSIAATDFILFCVALYMITVERQCAKADLGEIVGQFFL
jgi:vacuolar-type H+-ATPase subunit I/STV1